jgi:hypothetical protein
MFNNNDYYIGFLLAGETFTQSNLASTVGYWFMAERATN